MQPTLNIALRAARIASEQIARATERLEIIKSEQESVADFIASVCSSAEKTFAYNIHKSNPTHQVVGVHSGEIPSEEPTDSGLKWVINPIDGLANFAKGLPWFALTVVCHEKGKVEHALVINPITGEEFTASRGRGAQLNGRRLRVSPLKDFTGAMTVLGDNADKPEQFINLYSKLTELNVGVQKSDCDSLTMAYVAAGRLDACCLLDVAVDDIQTGMLMIQEAGGLTGDLAGNPKLAASGDILAANPKFFKQLLQALR